MKVPILKGVYSDNHGDYRTAYPVNLIPTAQNTGINDSYLRPAHGLVSVAVGSGPDRGGITVQGELYRVLGNDFARINADNSITVLGTVPGTGQCSFAYSFDNIGISADGVLLYFAFSTQTLTQVLDPNLGVCLYIAWLDGYFCSTDGNYIITSMLSNPAAFNPLNYGSSEVVPDPILSIQVLRNHMYAVNRYSIEQFQNVGGQFFPFQRVDGGFLPKGAVGSYACCVYEDALAFVGSGQNEAAGVWMDVNSNFVKISPKEIDQQIQRYTDAELANVLVEARNDNSHRFLYIHLPHGTYVYDAAASADLGDPVWHVLRSTLDGDGIYNARNFTYCYNKWYAGNPSGNDVVTLDDSIGSHLGQTIGWEVSTIISYNGGEGGLFYEMELICLTGRILSDTQDPTIRTTYSNDSGVTWSNPRIRTVGRKGQREKRINWLQLGAMNDRRIQKFQGTSDAHLTIACLEARMEPLSN